MNPSPSDSWETLFAGAPPGSPSATVDLRVVRRAGRPFLLLPDDAKCAAQALALYPAQTTKARAAKKILSLALRTGFESRLEKIPVSVPLGDEFALFLADAAGPPAVELPLFAILPGNPNAEGRRFVILVFDSNDEPVAVVKAGMTPAARRLIAHEMNFLASVPPRTEGLPILRGKFLSPRLDAFALDFIPGNSPGLDDLATLAKLLSSWVAVGQLVTMNELPGWQRLIQAASDAPLPGTVQALSALRFHAVMTHGDCAPWNAKNFRGRWTFLDWERGELVGVPTWDWLHFVVQSAVLVRRETASAILSRIEKLFALAAFQDYASRAGVMGRERALATAYLSYCTRVLRQSEGLKTVTELESAAVQRWK